MNKRCGVVHNVDSNEFLIRKHLRDLRELIAGLSVDRADLVTIGIACGLIESLAYEPHDDISPALRGKLIELAARATCLKQRMAA